MVDFTTELWAGGGNNVGIVVPPAVIEELGRGKRVPVTVTIDGGYTYRSTTASMGGQTLISFNSETRAATGLGAGDTTVVTLEVDDAPRTVDAPDAVAAAFGDEPALASAWQALSPSNQKRLAASIDTAKTDETRARRVAKALEELRAKG